MESEHPPDIPVRPDIVYRGKFKGWRHFLQTGVKKAEAVLDVAKRLEETQLLLVSLPDLSVPNQVHISVFPNTEIAKKFMKARGYGFVKAYKLELGYDWQKVVNAHGTDYANGEWLIHNLNEFLFDIDLEWVR